MRPDFSILAILAHIGMGALYAVCWVIDRIGRFFGLIKDEKREQQKDEGDQKPENSGGEN